MNSKLLGVLTFAAGAALGSVVTAKLVKTKYDSIIQEEVNAVKEYFGRRVCEDGAAVEEPSSKIVVPENFESNITAATEALDNLKQTVVTASNGTWARTDEKIYLISPEELGEVDDYDIVGLSYYEEDHVLADSDGVRVELDVIGGKEMLENFGEYEEDVLQVRNDTHRTDYEVYLVHDSYFDTYARD